MRPRLNLRHLMIASGAVALLASIAVSMARSSAQPVFAGAFDDPTGSTIIVEERYEVPFLPILALAVGAWWVVRRVPIRARIVALLGVGVGLSVYVQVVMELLRRYR